MTGVAGVCTGGVLGGGGAVDGAAGVNASDRFTWWIFLTVGGGEVVDGVGGRTMLGVASGRKGDAVGVFGAFGVSSRSATSSSKLTPDSESNRSRVAISIF